VNPVKVSPRSAKKGRIGFFIAKGFINKNPAKKFLNGVL
jgi:hypothetical protein